MANHDDQQPIIRCSFCGKREGQAQMIAGPGVYICSDCVSACGELLRDEMHFDDIVIDSGMSVAQLSTLLTNMEMIGLIEKLPGNYFVAK